jgi:hypothetical protein
MAREFHLVVEHRPEKLPVPERALKVRSYQGLLVHAFGRCATAMLLLVLNP